MFPGGSNPLPRVPRGLRVTEAVENEDHLRHSQENSHHVVISIFSLFSAREENESGRRGVEFS